MWKKMLLVLVMVSFMVGTLFAGSYEDMVEAWPSDKATCIQKADEILADTTSSAIHKTIAKKYKVFCTGVEDTPISVEELKTLGIGGIDYIHYIKDKTRKASLLKQLASFYKPILLGDASLNRGYWVKEFMLADLGGQDFLLKVLQRDNVFYDNRLKKLLAKCTAETIAKANLQDKAREHLKNLDWTAKGGLNKSTIVEVLIFANLSDLSVEEVDNILVKCYRRCFDKSKNADSLSLILDNMSPETRAKFVKE